MIVLTDLEDIFVPSPDLFINLKEYKVAIEEFLKKLNKIFSFSYVNNNAFGSALKAGYEMLVIYIYIFFLNNNIIIIIIYNYF